VNGSKLSSNFKLVSPNKMEMQLNLKAGLKNMCLVVSSVVVVVVSA
jgi:hypothetical protein